MKAMSLFSSTCVDIKPVTGEVPVKILGVIFYLVNKNRWHEALDISSAEY